MSDAFNLGSVSPEFDQKIFTIADEVLKILKELSLENKTNIDSKQIAERMLWKDSLKSLLSDIKAITEDEGVENGCLKELSALLMDKFSELIPAYMASKLGVLKDVLHTKELDGGSKEWIDSPLEVVKHYIDSISTRNNELEDFLNKTVEHISSSEENMSKGLSVQQQRLNEDIEFENGITSNIDQLKHDINSSNDLSNIKALIMSKIEDINCRIALKRDQDIKHVKETESTLKEMNSRMTEMKREADEIKRKSQSIEYDASHDALTGIYNRKAYEIKLKQILADVSRYGTNSSLMICDIDHFMQINDKWGHKLGDLALKKLAVHIKDMMRINDFIARYGEDVYAIILPHTDAEGAHLAGERLRSYVDKAKFSYKGETVPLTVSIGISCFRKDDDMHTVYQRANLALRCAKNAGRNKVAAEEKPAA